MADRISCCVPGCRRTIAEGRHSEWVCGKHWPMVPRSTKAEFRRVRQRIRKIIAKRPEYLEYWKMPAGSPGRIRAVNMWARYKSAWEKCKRQAIETSVGI